MSYWKADLMELRPSIGQIIEETATYDLDAEIDALVAELQEHPEEFAMAIPGVSLKSVWEWDFDELLEMMEADYPDPSYRRPTENRALKITRNKFYKPTPLPEPGETAEFWLFVKEAIIQQEIYLLPPLFKTIAQKDRTRAKEMIAYLKAKGQFGARKNSTPPISSDNYTEQVTLPPKPFVPTESTEEQKTDTTFSVAMPEAFRRDLDSRAIYENLMEKAQHYTDEDLMDLSIADLDNPGKMTGASLSQLTLISPSAGTHKVTMGPGNNNSELQNEILAYPLRWATGTFTATEVRQYRNFEGNPIKDPIPLAPVENPKPFKLTKTQSETVRVWSLTRYRAIEQEEPIKYSGEKTVTSKRAAKRAKAEKQTRKIAARTTNSVMKWINR